MNAAHKLPRPHGEDDVYSAPTRIGPMARGIVQELMAKAEAATPAPHPATPPPPVSAVCAPVRAGDVHTTNPAQLPPGPHEMPRLFDEADDGDDGDDGDHLDPASLFGPKQSGATVLLDMSRVGSVIDVLERGLAADRPCPTIVHLALDPGAVVARRRQRWSLLELAVMAISFLGVAVPALYVLLTNVI